MRQLFPGCCVVPLGVYICDPFPAPFLGWVKTGGTLAVDIAATRLRLLLGCDVLV
jgi:hypothetical protein